MKNEQDWIPTKYVKYKKTYRASRNPKQVGVSFRLITDITVQLYASHSFPLGYFMVVQKE